MILLGAPYAGWFNALSPVPGSWGHACLSTPTSRVRHDEGPDLFLQVGALVRGWS